MRIYCSTEHSIPARPRTLIQSQLQYRGGQSAPHLRPFFWRAESAICCQPHLALAYTMSNALPTSLSPHISILSSPDLVDLLQSSGLPPLHHVLQSFSPLPQVTTRTTSLTSVPHAAFALRFSDLLEIESQSNEDEERRAARTLDWIGERLANRAGKWVEDVEGKAPARTPWWDEVRRCAEGDHIPNRNEGWNHPVAGRSAVCCGLC